MILNRFQLSLLCWLGAVIPLGDSTPIIGGEPIGVIAKVNGDLEVKSDRRYPYIVHINFETKRGHKKNDFHCGGVLIGRQTVLTAAHCIRDLKSDPHLITVTAGNPDLWLEEGEQIYATEYSVHENYVKNCEASGGERQFCGNDIALLWTEKAFTLSSKIQIAVLASKNSAIRKNGYIFGWGMAENGVVPHMLRKADIMVTSQRVCKEEYPRFAFDETKLCLISKSRTSTICKGDSGGPYISNGIVYGIASFGRTSCNPNKPTVFTNVAFYEEWIKDEVDDWASKEYEQLKFEVTENTAGSRGRSGKSPAKNVPVKTTKRRV